MYITNFNAKIQSEKIMIAFQSYSLSEWEIEIIVWDRDCRDEKSPCRIIIEIKGIRH